MNRQSTTRQRQALRFTRIALRNWRNFSSAEVHLASRAFFIGPNAIGKSNLLDAIRFLRDLVKPRGGGLVAAVQDRGSMSTLRNLQARGARSYIEISVDVGTDEDLKKWTYILRFNRVEGLDYPSVLIEGVLRQGKPVMEEVERPKSPDDPKLYSQTKIEQVSENTRFRELADFFANVRYLHVVPQIVRDSRRAIAEGEDPFGGDLLRRMSETPKKTLSPRLRRIAQALSIAVPDFVDLELGKDTTGRPHLFASYKHWRPQASKQGEETFSDGTLRLIGFLWSLAEKGGPLLLEEPELSLHADLVRQLPAMIYRMQRLSGRQVLMTSHSEALVGAEGVGLHEVHRLVPTETGTVIETAAQNEKVRALVEGGLSVGEAVMPLARPEKVEQLSLFDVSHN